MADSGPGLSLPPSPPPFRARHRVGPCWPGLGRVVAELPGSDNVERRGGVRRKAGQGRSGPGELVSHTGGAPRPAPATHAERGLAHPLETPLASPPPLVVPVLAAAPAVQALGALAAPPPVAPRPWRRCA